jgi:hypothetical protein
VKTGFRVAVAAAIVLVLTVVGGAARAADPLQLEPDVVTAKGFGHFGGSVKKIPHGNKVVSEEARHQGKEPDDFLHTKTVVDDAVQASGGAAANATSAASFPGLDHSGWGAGWPPDPSGDAGRDHYVQTVNTSVGIFEKGTGLRVAAFTFDDLFTQGATGTPCDDSNQGDPVTVYDPFGDRFVVSDFAWDEAQETTGPFYECFAVSKTGDPVNGGWYFYAFQVESGASLPDYPKLGAFQNVQVWSFDRAAMEAGDPGARAVTFSVPRTIGGVNTFSLLPSNARSVTGAPPAGAANYFASIWGSYAIRVWKFHVDWANPSASTFSGPTNSAISTFNVGPGDVPEKDGNNLDTLSYRLMMQNQYTNIGGRESLWLTHTVGSGGTPNTARVRWYELPVTGGTIAAPRQQSTWAPDAKNRFVPSLAVDRSGDMAIGYSVSDATMYPAIRYSGRLAGDAAGQLTQGETTLVQGLGFQCCTFSDGSLNKRWGDYTAMTIDPDGCTFWYTGEYYDAQPTTKDADNWLTRIGSFRLPGCGSVAPAAPTVSGFSPTSGPAGTSVTVSGTGFTGATSVAFNGVPAQFSVPSDTQITATVPAAATSGAISVTGPGGTGTSAASFTVTTPPSAAPTISGFSPTSGRFGTRVTISGSHFTGTTLVTFGGGKSAAFTVASDVQITATVPSGAKSGPITVRTGAGSATSAQTFSVR